MFDLYSNILLLSNNIRKYTFEIIPTPSNAKVIINGEVINTVSLEKGSEIIWSVTLDGYEDREGTLTLEENIVLDIVLEKSIIDPEIVDKAVTFNYTGSVQTYNVPKGCKKIRVDCVGAGGGGYSGYNGKGGRVQCVMSVKSNTPLYLYIGGQGSTSPGWNGGGARKDQTSQGWEYNNAGAGASDIRTVQASSGSWYDTSHASWSADVSLLSRLVVAGGGGGMSNNGGGGNGGGLEGGVRVDSTGTPPTPATQTSGGKGAIQTNSGANWNGEDGTFGKGGAGAYNVASTRVTGGGGGGGWYGGGGGVYFQSGGGGSSYTHPDLCTEVVHTQGYRAGHGYITITPIG